MRGSTVSALLNCADFLVFTLISWKERSSYGRHFRTDRVGWKSSVKSTKFAKKVRDPRVQGVTITDVQMLGDLSMAKVYYSIMSDLASDNQRLRQALKKQQEPSSVN